MYVCMYMHVCMYVCMYVRTYMYACMHVVIYVCTYTLDANGDHRATCATPGVLALPLERAIARLPGGWSSWLCRP